MSEDRLDDAEGRLDKLSRELEDLRALVDGLPETRTPDRDETALLHAHLMVALCTQLASVRDTLFARLEVEYKGVPVARAKTSGEWADEVLADALKYLSELERESPPDSDKE